MPAETPVQLDALLMEALEQPPERRAAYIHQACGSDARLRHDLEALVQLHEQAGEFLEQPAVALPERADDAATGESPGTLIGSYKLLERIGEGGFGTVFLAEQKEPVRRCVALKVIKLGMDTRRVVARFEAERQALAMMDHPNIAKVFDGGATQTGRPYFVMELVKGLPITQYCDQHRLPLPERLALFTDVCHAVQHAHQKGIIHRDLKPSNVLVSHHDDKPVVKVIDFGIAKATGVQLTDKTLHSEWRQLIGTPTYMSPEQAGLSDLDVDTRSDIYSLGVLLYELLTGTTPFDKQSLLSSGFDEMRRIIQQVEPPKPSTRLASLLSARVRGSVNPAMQAGASSADDSSAQTLEALPDRTGWNPQSLAVGSSILRRTEAETLPRSLRGDLDWIVMKCLEKDRTRRYETANGLAADIQRHRGGEPVVAAPPSALYRLRKFARRHKAGAIAGTAVAAALILGIIGTSIGLSRANTQRELAEKREKETRQVSSFQAAMLSGIDVEAMGRGIKERFREQVRAALERQYVGEFPDRRKRTPEEIEAELAAFDERADAAQAADVARRVMDDFVLARAAEALEKEFADQPRVQAQLHHAIGHTYKELGLYDAAEPHFRAALDIERRELGEEDLAIGPSLHNLAQVVDAKGDYATAESMYRQALTALRRRPPGDEHRTVGPCLNSLAILLSAKGEHAEAEPLMRESLEITRKAYGDEHEHVANCLNSLGVVLQHQGKHAEAEPFLRQSLDMRRKLLGNEHPAVANSMNNLANLLMEQKDYPAAEALLTEALVIIRRSYGNDYPWVATLLSNLGTSFERQGDFARAEPQYREALALRRKLLGDEHPLVALDRHLLGVVQLEKGDYAAAEPLLREALAMRRKLLGDNHPDVAKTLGRLEDLALKLDDKGQYGAAESLFREALALRRTLLGNEDPYIATSLFNLAELLVRKGDRNATEPLLREAMAMRSKLPDDAQPQIAKRLNNLALALAGTGDYVAAEPLLRDALALAREHSPSDRALRALILHHLADSLRGQHKLDETEKLAREAIEIYEAGGDSSPRGRNEYRHSVDILSKTLVEAGRPGEAIILEREFINEFRRLVPAGDASLAIELKEFGMLLVQQKQLAEAEPILRECMAIGRQQPAGNAPLQNALAEFGLALLQYEKYEDAEPILRELLAIREKALTPDSKNYWKLPNVRSMLGGALAGQGAALIQSDAPAAIAKFSEAEPLLVEGGEWLIQNSNRVPQNLRAKRIREALNRIVKLYESWDAVAPGSGKAEQAAKWRAELKQLPGP